MRIQLKLYANNGRRLDCEEIDLFEGTSEERGKALFLEAVLTLRDRRHPDEMPKKIEEHFKG